MTGRRWALVAALAVTACDRAAPPAPRVQEPAPAPSPSAQPVVRPPPPPPPALPHAGELVPLAVDGFAEAVVAVARDGARPRPVAVATHGNYDTPGWQCQEWRRTLGGRGFVLCPRGEPRPDSPAPDDVRFTYPNNEALERELDAGLAALKTRFGEHVAEGAVLYTGFSLGAIMGVKIAARHPARYSRLVLVEGGHDDWTAARAEQFAQGGGQRVLFACGQKGCQLAAERAAKRLEAAGVHTRVVWKNGLGHSYGGPLGELIEQQLDWLLEGDPRW